MASKTAYQLNATMKKVLQESWIVLFDNIHLNTCAAVNEAAPVKSEDLLTNYKSVIRCVVHTLALCVNGFFQECSFWTMQLNEVY